MPASCCGQLRQHACRSPWETRRYYAPPLSLIERGE
jgi:hypothetical protein